MFALRFHTYGDPEVLAVDHDVPEPHPGPGQVRVAVRAAGVTPGDANLRRGRFPLPRALPHIPGVEAAGIVDELGDGVTGTAVGDAVFGIVPLDLLGGAAAQFAVLDLWAPTPQAWDWDQAGGAAANTETAARALRRLDLRPGQTLLVEGAAGGVGTMAVQLALAAGLVVVGTARTANHEFLTGLGAAPVTYGPGLADRVQGRTVDGVLDAAGSGSLPDLVALAGSPDRVVSVADIDAAAHGVHLSSTVGPGADPQHPTALADAAALAERGLLRVPVHAALPLDRAAEAHTISESRRVRGKLVLRVGRPD
ncbi:NADP-dependent oxidoreductase [Actinophytocola sediminis]